MHNNIFKDLLEIFVRINEKRYKFGDGNYTGTWVCSKEPHDGRVMKNCVPKYVTRDYQLNVVKIMCCRPRAPQWYVHLQEDVDYQGCNGGVCFCDDRDGCNTASNHHFYGALHLFTTILLKFI